MDQKVKGTIFSEYIRMIKSNQGMPWGDHLTEEDLKLVDEMILASNWYPLDVYKRMGLAVFKLLAKSNLKAAWMWGRSSLEEQTQTYRNLIKKGDPVRTIRNLPILMGRLVNFETMDVKETGPTEIEIVFKMVFGDEADEAYAHHFGGLMERMVEVSGAESVKVEFKEKCWEGSPNTVFRISWQA